MELFICADATADCLTRLFFIEEATRNIIWELLVILFCSIFSKSTRLNSLQKMHKSASKHAKYLKFLSFAFNLACYAGCRWYWFKFTHFRSDEAAFIPINYRVMNIRLIAGWKSCNQSYWCECFDREKWNEKVWWSKSISKKLFRKKFHWRGCWRLISLETVPTSFHAALRRCRWSALALTTGNLQSHVNRSWVLPSEKMKTDYNPLTFPI